MIPRLRTLSNDSTTKPGGKSPGFLKQYAYDLSGRQISITDLDGRVTSYTYDSIGRLTAENRTAGTTGTPYAKSYTYDGFSNRVELVENASETDYTYDAANRLLNSTADGVVTQYTYNDRGDLLTAQEGTETATQYTYDVFGKQTAVVGEGLSAAYTYYPDDLRKTKTVNGITTTYVWDGDQIVLELTAGAVRKYIRGLQLIACVSGDNISYYHHDGHGNVVQLSDTSGVVTRTYEYDAFGEQLNIDAADANPFRYCGEYYDAETGTYYLRARHYAVDLGRFTQQDTHWTVNNRVYGDKEYQDEESKYPDMEAILQSGNLYVYCINDPIMYVDPDGELAFQGQIHNWVVNDLASQYGLYTEEFIIYSEQTKKESKRKWGRADLISRDGRVWEVKPDKPRHIVAGRKQVNWYVNNTWLRNSATKLSRGGFIPSGSMVRESGADTYYINYRYVDSGVIAYTYQKITDWDKVKDYAKDAIGVVVIGGVTYGVIVSGGTAAPVLVPVTTQILGG